MKNAYWYRLWRAIVNQDADAPQHQHTMDCTPENCDISTDQYMAMRHTNVITLRSRRGGKTLEMDQVSHQHCNEVIEIYRDALRPFARMHRPDDQPHMLLLTRGKGENVSILRAVDFDRAFYLLDEHNI